MSRATVLTPDGRQVRGDVIEWGAGFVVVRTNSGDRVRGLRVYDEPWHTEERRADLETPAARTAVCRQGSVDTGSAGVG